MKSTLGLHNVIYETWSSGGAFGRDYKLEGCGFLSPLYHGNSLTFLPA